MKGIKTIAILLAMAAIPVSASAQETLEIPAELMEAIQTDVAIIHQELMQANIILEPGHTATFWGIYDEYLDEVKAMAAERTELIKDLALAFETLTDDQAMEMGRRAIQFDAQRNELVAKYFERIGSEVSGKVAGQFLQIESRIATIKDLRLEMEIPIIGG
jgi:hypothetical protein